MTVVGFDSATADTSACAVRDGEVLHESRLGPSDRGAPLHTAALLGEIEGAVAAAGGWAAVDRIAVGIGPGTFTGLRIGVATARALGFARGIPVSGVCTLDALGRALGEDAGERERLAVLDARRGEVFAARYSVTGERLGELLVCSPEDLAERLQSLETALCGGSGAVRFREQLTIRGVEIPDDADPVHRIAARHVCALAATAPSEDDSAPVAPIYLRPPDAERWHERDSLQKTG